MVDVPDYHLPEGAIAQVPAEPRDSARLLDALTGPGVRHRRVTDLPDALSPGDVVVINETKVMSARLALQKLTGGLAEVLLIEPTRDPDAWTALVRPGRRLPPGTRLRYPEESEDVLEVDDLLDGGLRTVRFLRSPEEVMARSGSVALPPYIREKLADPDRYQTVFAASPGSVAAPTAGLHLTRQVLHKLTDGGIQVVTVDLAVGLATFKPVSAERAEDHVIHTERYRVPAETWEACQSARRVVAIGTTSVRALETVAATGNLEGRSDLFIFGDYPYRVVDVLMTNFHMPRSSLLLLLEAFCGPRWRDLYSCALDEGYRFLSFGDAMVVGRA